MCRTYTEIQLQTSILVLLLEQVRTQGRAKSRLGKETFIKKGGPVHDNQKSGEEGWSSPRGAASTTPTRGTNERNQREDGRQAPSTGERIEADSSQQDS